jgi:hypothetical protein
MHVAVTLLVCSPAGPGLRRHQLVCGSIDLVTLIYLVQHGDMKRPAGDPGLTELGSDQAPGQTAAAWAVANAGQFAGDGMPAGMARPAARGRVVSR